jgi:hypothetical protein
MGEPLVRDADEHRAHVLLLARRQASPELLGSNRVVGLGGWRRSGGGRWHRG